MTTACPVHPAPLAVQQGAGKPKSRFYRIAHRIAGRMEPAVSRAFLDAVAKLQASIDRAQLRKAIAGGDLPTIEAAAKAGTLGAVMANDARVADALLRTGTLTGEAGLDVLEDVTGFAAQFNRRQPNVVLFAREQAATLIKQVGPDVREAVRHIVAAGADLGLTTDQQAMAIRHVVGLRPDHVPAVLNFREDLRAAKLGGDKLVGRAVASVDRRRLDAATKAQLKKKLRDGTLTDADILEAERTYSKSLLNYRAKSIARTETLRAAHHGQREAWRAARDQDVIPATARRRWVVTPDDRLRETHAAIPGMNPDGVGLDGVFETPLGPSEGPPLETHCRCSEGLTFPGTRGVL